MKTRIILGCSLVAVLAFYGCSKVEEDNKIKNATGTHTLTFEAQKDVDTRTYVVEGENTASYYWDLNDKQYFHIYENGISATSMEMTLSDGGKVASFKATFPDTDATEFTYSAVYAQDITTAGDICVPVFQYPSHSSYDPAADVLVSAENVSLKDYARVDENTVIRFKMRRQASVNKITVKGIEPGEKVYGVALYADQPLGGYYYYDGDGTKYDRQTTLWINCSEWDESERIIGSDGSVSAYFLSLPITKASATVRVWTEKNIYKRDLTSKLTLETDVFRRFSVTMKEVSPQLNVSAAGLACPYDYPLEFETRDKEFTITNMGDRYTAVYLKSSGDAQSYYSFTPASFGLNPGETVTIQVHFSFYSGSNLNPSDTYGTIDIDTLLVETAAFTYEIPVSMWFAADLEEPK